MQRTTTPDPLETTVSIRLFCPLLLADGIAEELQESRDFRIWRPKETDPGIAITLDEERDYHRRRAE